ncbi:hypothetical protein GGS23DRAFT_470422 [Durotheca rogersii]|uniref:uncharacterized protein n=1 Tax=Durotheca rogersii TaxID=419775 RepID=UPI00221F7B17|nr:uncharacterized protein GGS23DRAFT_470422 [Durotheca rogersii]KAI5864954.1 hypothetical protein GGS23DRAFT_470422 [Durotheca rogersii]
MLGTSTPEYIFIRVCIFLVQYTTPVCLALLALLAALRNRSAATPPSLLLSPSNPLDAALVAYVIADLLYAAFVFAPRARRLGDSAAAAAAANLSPRQREERRALFHRCLAHVPDIRRYMQMWFLGADEAEIRRDNVRDFLLWAFFDRAPSGRAGGGGREEDEDEDELGEYIAALEQRLGRKFGPGRGQAEGLRLTLDKVETRYRSVGWYLVVGLVDLVTHCRLAWSGFHYYAQPGSRVLSVVPPRLQDVCARRRSVAAGLTYWYRPHTATDKLPVVFLHGIGIGLYTYVPFLSRLNSSGAAGEAAVEGGEGTEGQIGIIAIEMLPISFRLTDVPLAKPEFLRQVATILEAHGWDRFVLVSHSYGTVLATHMLRAEGLAGRIASVVLIDPVTILLHLPDVAYNFTRRKPKRANEWQLWYFASMDPGVARCLGRHFLWKDNIVWKEELVGSARGLQSVDDAGGGVGVDDRGTRATGQRPRKVAVCLAERDLIVDTLTVVQYLAANDDGWLTPGPADEEGSTGSVGRPEERDGWASGNHLTCEGIELLWFWGLDHAQVFDSKQNRDRLCRVVRRYCTK